MKKKILIYFSIICAVITASITINIVLSKRKPNIIIITMDALRPDYMGCYGYKRNTTPNIDKFAKDAAIFAQAISHSSHTAPSNSSLITSTYPSVHKAEDWGYKINPNLPTLAEILKSHGYTTAFISDQIGFSWLRGFDRGFDVFNLFLSTRRLPSGKEVKLVDITKHAIKWLKNNKNKRFFLWVYYLDPHGPYTPASPYDEMFINDGIYTSNKTLPICKNKYKQTGIGCIPYYIKKGDIRNTGYYVSQYCGEIRQTDALLGKLFNTLKELGLSKNTIIIFTSDHGEGMGEHSQYFCHTIYLYDYLIHIPLIIRNPRLDIKNNHINQQVRVIDIAPTILDFVGIRKPKSMQGVSLKSFILGKRNYFTRFTFGKWLDKNYIRTEKWKLIYNKSDGSYELYNLKKDPQEINNLVSKENKMFVLLKNKLFMHIALSAKENRGEKMEFTGEEKEILRSLGYAQ